jgi:hypothetical protein
LLSSEVADPIKVSGITSVTPILADVVWKNLREMNNMDRNYSNSDGINSQEGKSYIGRIVDIKEKKDNLNSKLKVMQSLEHMSDDELEGAIECMDDTHQSQNRRKNASGDDVHPPNRKLIEIGLDTLHFGDGDNIDTNTPNVNPCYSHAENPNSEKRKSIGRRNREDFSVARDRGIVDKENSATIKFPAPNSSIMLETSLDEGDVRKERRRNSSLRQSLIERKEGDSLDNLASIENSDALQVLRILSTYHLH